MGRIRRRLGTLLFWIAAVILSIPIVAGFLKSGVRPQRAGTVFVQARTLPVRTVPGVEARVQVAGLGEKPKLQLKARGLAKGAPLQIVLVDPGGAAKPMVLKGAIPVKPEGSAEASIPVPDRAFQRYGEVIFRQGKRVVFRAGLG